MWRSAPLSRLRDGSGSRNMVAAMSGFLIGVGPWLFRNIQEKEKESTGATTLTGSERLVKAPETRARTKFEMGVEAQRMGPIDGVAAMTKGRRVERPWVLTARGAQECARISCDAATKRCGADQTPRNRGLAGQQRQVQGACPMVVAQPNGPRIAGGRLQGVADRQARYNVGLRCRGRGNVAETAGPAPPIRLDAGRIPTASRGSFDVEH